MIVSLTFNTLINGFCRTGKTLVALKLFEEMADGRNELGDICKPDVVTYDSIIDGLGKDGFLIRQRNCFCLLITL